MTTQKLWTNSLNDISVAMLVITQRNSFTSSIIRISGQYNDYSTILIFLFMILYGSLPQWLTSSKLCLSPDAQGFRMQATSILKNLSVTLMLKQEWGKKTPYPKNISNMLGTSLETWLSPIIWEGTRTIFLNFGRTKNQGILNSNLNIHILIWIETSIDKWEKQSNAVW